MDQQKKQKHILMNKAFFYLRFRARSVSEMRRYLLKKSQIFKFNNTIVDSVIAELIEEKYINDTEFAQEYIRSRSQINPKGNYAIVQELQQKGVNKTIIEAALKENTIDELTRARDVLKKKNNLLIHLTSEKRMQRALGYLQRRGFPYSVAKQAYDAYFDNTL